MIPKFRVWEKRESRMIASENCTAINFFEQKLIETQWFGKGKWVNISHDFNDIISMQSTGLKDSNGVEIYEGDVIEWSYWVGDYEEERGRSEIKVFDGAFRLKDSNDEALYDFTEWAEEYYVVGNVYENPELLEGE